MLYKKKWAETREKWCNYWKQQNTGRPLMHVLARKPEMEQYVGTKAPGGVNDSIICQGRYYTLPEGLWWKDLDDKYLNAKGLVDRYRVFCENHIFLAEAFPNLDVCLGPGSTAAYLGSDVGFSEDTIWFKPCVADEWDDHPEIKFDPNDRWFSRHLKLVTDARKLMGDDVLLDMPDLMENLDVLSSLRGAQELMMDLIEDPDMIKERVDQVTKAYFPIFDAFYEQVKDAEGGITCNCGLIEGGTAANTVAECCSFTADIRFVSAAQLEQARETVARVTQNVTVPGCVSTATQISFRPAMEEVERNFRLFDKMNEIYDAVGLPHMIPNAAKGGSDAAYVTIAGIPCVDNLGTEGWEIHSINERMKLFSLAESAKRIAAVTYCIGDEI